MPLRMTRTCGRDFTKRSARDAMLQSGCAAFKSAFASGVRSASLSSAHRLHDHDGDIALFKHPVRLPGLAVLPVEVVYPELGEIPAVAAGEARQSLHAFLAQTVRQVEADAVGFQLLLLLCKDRLRSGRRLNEKLGGEVIAVS